MNMLPINSEWKRRIKWAEKQQREQQAADKAKKQAMKKLMKKIQLVQED